MFRFQELNDKLNSALKSQQIANESSDKLAELAQKVENAESLNKKLLTEMAQLQQEKLAIEGKFADISQKIEQMQRLAADNEKTVIQKLIGREWHFLGEKCDTHAFYSKENCVLMMMTFLASDISFNRFDR